MNFISLTYHRLCDRIVRYAEYYRLQQYRQHLGYCANDAVFKSPDVCACPQKIYLYENTNIYEHAKFIISPDGENGKFIMKRNSGSAEGLTVITGNHHRSVGVLFKTHMADRTLDEDKDVIIDEDVWIGANVTLLAGVHVGRGATIAANAVCAKNIPPYAIVMGNPAKVIGFNYTPKEVIQHEKELYTEEERIEIARLEKNYKKYYLDRLDEIATII